MGKYKIPRNVGNKQLWGGMDFRGWIGALPFLLVAMVLIYWSFGLYNKGANQYVCYAIGAVALFIGCIGYGLFKPLPQLTERPIVFILRRLRAGKAQKKFSYGRVEEGRGQDEN